ncbi:MAG: MoaD/ThiS family protein [Deltaproteobacteria bacterium]|nr:MoaD/ThiS family protein [Deltaproteobacteria bacterium]
MAVKLHIHKTHRQITDGQDVVDVDGKTVGECLKDLIRQYPDFKETLFDKKGKLLNVVEIYVNMESAYPDELKKPVTDGDTIHITIMLAGG